MDESIEKILLHTYSREELEKLKVIESKSKRSGIVLGMIVGGLVGFYYYAMKQRGQRVSSYNSGIISLVSGLTTSQLSTHYLFLKWSDQIRFQRRLDAVQKQYSANK